MTLFGTDGVRGKAGKKVNAVNAMRLAMATGIYFKQFAKAMGTIMCGKENSHKAKIGLYSIEFLPMNWLIDPNPN